MVPTSFFDDVANLSVCLFRHEMSQQSPLNESPPDSARFATSKENADRVVTAQKSFERRKSMTAGGFSKESRDIADVITYEDVDTVAEFVLRQAPNIKPRIGIICGSGLGGLADTLTDAVTIFYKDVPKFPVSTVPGHAGALILGKLAGLHVICMKGRFHMYEGYPMWKVAMPVRVMKSMGVQLLIVTNAAGGLHPDYQVGDIMIIRDHINMPGFSGEHPLIGIDDRFGSKFVALNNAYARELRQLARQAAGELGLAQFIREGTYAFLSGPSYETPAEGRALRLLGADAVGMSTVPEVIVAKQGGMAIFGVSLITNKVVQDDDAEVFANHEEVLRIGQQRAEAMQQLITLVVQKLPHSSFFAG